MPDHTGPPPPLSTSKVALPASSTSPSTSPTRAPGTIDLPLPSLAHDPDPDTNTLAILLPHQAFFAPPSLQILRDAFAAYGTLAHWAPVRAMGRVIAVYTREADAAEARRHADGLKLDVALVDIDVTEGKAEGDKAKDVKKEKGDGYFGHERKSSRANNGLTLRVYALPPTPLDAEPDHLRPPDQGRNFLISPPGSPPEGWEPIVEDGPNMAPLADDLRRALEALQFQGRGHSSGPEVILDEGGVRVEVEDTTEEDGEWGEEYVAHAGEDAWAAPRQEEPADGGASVPRFGSFGGAGGDAGPGGLGARSPAGRILPTARPPV